MEGAVEIKDFRPISLMGCLYKLLSKILALRLKATLQKIISKSPNTFVLGRQIMDCSFLANECVDTRLKEGRPGIICQIDMEKAYDHASWPYPDWVLGQMGFGI